MSVPTFDHGVDGRGVLPVFDVEISHHSVIPLQATLLIHMKCAEGKPKFMSIGSYGNMGGGVLLLVFAGGES